jgi:hypothetical protein
MIKENVLIGIIVIYRQEVRLFSDKQIELVSNLSESLHKLTISLL